MSVANTNVVIVTATDVDDVLPRTRKALAQARRQLNDLQSRRDDIVGFRDLLPYVLDRLLNVWRSIETESRGRRTPAFGTWWKGQLAGNREWVASLRNIELKDNHETSKADTYYRGTNAIQVFEDGHREAIRPDGSIAPRLPDGGLDAGDMVRHSIRWEFVVPGLEGREAEEILELVFCRLDSEILPHAEKLIREFSVPV